MSSLTLDLRQALRGLARRPAFALVATLTLAVAIGAASAVFTIVDAALLAPLPYSEPDRLLRIYERDVTSGRDRGQVALADFRDWRASARSVSTMAVTRYATSTLTGRGEAERLFALRVSPAFFDVLGVRPALGRGFATADGREGSLRVVVISHGLFERRFGADPKTVGSTVTLDAQPTTVVGVLPAGFRSPLGGDTEVFLTEEFEWLARDATRARRMHTFQVIARLADGVAGEQARDELLTIGRRLEADHRDNAGHQPNAVPLHESLVYGAAPLLRTATGAVALLLLVAAINVAGLALARGLSRQHDVAVRAALGAGSADLLRVPLIENLLVAAAGGLLGALLAASGAEALATAAGPEWAPFGASVSWRLVGFVATASALVGLGSGLAPAAVALRSDLLSVVKGAATGATAPAARMRLRSTLVGAQVALASVLLVACGLLLRTTLRLDAVDPGFEPNGVLTFRTSLPGARYADQASRVAVQTAIQERLRALPGVRQVAVSYTLPFTNLSTTSLVRPDRPPAAGPGAPAPEVGYNSVSADYFAAIGVPVQRGRSFDARDTLTSPPVVIVNRALADRFFAGEDAVGRTIRVGNGYGSAEIVGVVGNVLRGGLDDAPAPELFHVATQDVTPSPVILVRAAPEAVPGLAEAIRHAVRETDTSLPVFGLRTLSEVVATTVAPRRLLLALLASFGAAALLLATLGVFGVAASLVVQRRREIAVRMAVGARAEDVVRLVLARSLAPVAAGLALGAVAASALAQVLGSLLFGVTTHDLPTHAGVFGLLLTTATIACLLPARRAVAVAPSEVLRGD